MNKITNNIIFGLKVILPIALLLAGSDAFAAAETRKLDDQLGDLEGTVEASGSAFRTVVAFVGALFAAGGIMGLKKYGEDRERNDLLKPLIALIAGSLMFGFGAFTGMLTQTTTDAAVENEEVFERSGG